MKKTTFADIKKNQKVTIIAPKAQKNVKGGIIIMGDIIGG